MPELAVIGRRLCEPPTGVGRYLECLLRWWKRDPGLFERIRVFCPGEPRLSDEARGGPIQIEIVPPRVSPLFWENFQLPSRLRGADLIFAPYTLPWTLASRGVVSNLGIYDASQFSWLARLRTEPFFRHSARAARAVVVNSASTAHDVENAYGPFPDRKVVVALLGADERLRPGEPGQPLDEAVRRKYGLPYGPFFLMAGKLSKRRNVPLLIEAFARAGLPGHRLVLVGPDYLGLDPASLAREHGVGEAVTHLDYVPMEDLEKLYQATTAFVLPTEHEGFSLTIPEAMACGAPVIAFDHAALEGCLRWAVAIVEPRTAAGLSQVLIEIATSAALRQRLRERSLAAVATLRWEDTARTTMFVLEEALR